MLEYIWFAILMIVAVWGVWMHIESEGEGNIEGYLLVSFSACMAAIYLLWNSTLNLLLVYLMASLPEAGTNIHVVTAYIITGRACFLFVLGVPIGITIVFDTIKKAKHNH